MSYLLERSSDAYVSISGLGDPDDSVRYVETIIRPGVKKLQKIVGASQDGIWGPVTQSKWIAWVRANVPRVAALPDNQISVFTVSPELVTAGLSATDLASAAVGWNCYQDPNNPKWARLCQLLKSSAAASSRTAPSTQGGPVVEEEQSFFDKYWWLIALGALGVGSFFFWKMRKSA